MTTVIVNEGAIRARAKKEERARICTHLALESHKRKGPAAKGLMDAATIVARMPPEGE